MINPRELHQHQPADHRQKAQSVDQKAPAGAYRRQDNATHCRANYPGRIEDRRVECNSVGEVFPPNHIDDEYQPSRGVKSGYDPTQDSQDDYMPDLHHVGEDEDREDEGEKHLQRLGQQQQSPALNSVGDDPTPGGNDQ